MQADKSVLDHMTGLMAEFTTRAKKTAKKVKRAMLAGRPRKPNHQPVERRSAGRKAPRRLRRRRPSVAADASKGLPDARRRGVPLPLYFQLDQFVKLVVEFADHIFRFDRLTHFAGPFAFGRSTRSSRNSGGPLVSRRRRCARSSGAAAGSIIFSIACVASS